MRKSKLNLFDILVGIVFLILCFLTVYPFIYALSFSISDTIMAAQHSVVFLPRGLTWQNYEMIFKDDRVIQGFLISAGRTIIGTALFVLVTGLCAYAMSKQRLKGRRMLFIFFVIPLYLSGGLLPYYVLIHDLNLFNNFLVYVIPGCFSGFYMFLIKVYLENVPESMEESAMLDGANDLQIAFRIYAPLAIPVLATVTLFICVTQWNSWFDALLFVTKPDLQPLQLILQVILRETQIDNLLQVYAMTTGVKPKVNAESYKMAVLIVTTLPIVFIYPFAQKYFVKGTMIGAVKM
ncbi:carbohydrate ABC transporter permease [Cohnella fermenti]|uniref:Carbohydrate ABC transporter permease n=1 Tax=Cohnella fermenti TaxID=2565925 RepID=A0A4S4C1U1_9BACL|nr:carbohydrate ABC transporter permease [Cohnella fermenti]THF81622.1 carbohydrate ABC transporter permease [Cohnella fermenti]